MTASSLTRFAVALAALAVPVTVLPAHATTTAGGPGDNTASCYTEAVFRLAEPLDDEPSDTRFHSVGEGTSRCFGTLEGRTIDPTYGEFTASGSAQSTSCQSGTGSLLGHLKVRDLTGEALQVPVSVSFTRVGLTGRASGELTSDGTPLHGAFAAQPSTATAPTRLSSTCGSGSRSRSAPEVRARAQAQWP